MFWHFVLAVSFTKAKCKVEVTVKIEIAWKLLDKDNVIEEIVI